MIHIVMASHPAMVYRDVVKNRDAVWIKTAINMDGFSKNSKRQIVDIGIRRRYIFLGVKN